MSKTLPTVTREEVAKHNTKDSAWIVVDDHVYDVTRFAALHPGGEKLLVELAGTDQTKDFWGLHRSEVLDKYHDKLAVARLKDAPERATYVKWAELSPTPFGEPSHMRPGWASPFYTDDMKRFRVAVRAILDKELRPWCEKAELSNEYPSKELFMKLGEEGILAAVLGEGPHLRIPPRLPGGVKPDAFNLWHTCIVHEEFGRLGCPGAADSIIAGLMISLPVVIHFGLKDKALAKPVIEDVVLGRKRMVLAVTEPFAGSDVANVRHTAKKSADGSHYVLNGVKKWITGGATADYFVTLSRTGGPGAGGLTYFLVERGDGLETKQISTAYAKSAGTAYVVYEDVKVPVGMMVGSREGAGFVQAMQNFVQERLGIVARMMAVMRGVVDECWKWAAQREAFGKSLMSQPVIRFKLGDLTARLEAVQAWYEAVIFQMTQMDFKTRGEKLSSTVSLLKYESTRVGALIADQAPMIFGGRAITQTGMGKLIERYVRTIKFAAILGGAEDVLADQAVRLALKQMSPAAKL